MKSWGKEIIPKNEWIDQNKQYTSNGKRVINIKIELYNSCGNEVTYPVKGTIVVSEKPFKTKYAIWSLNGKANVMCNSVHDLTIVV